ncbi:hypothetical protein BH18ACT5_BH18ACT5_13200 [soil metagenome]
MSPRAIVGFLLLAACVTNPAPSTTVPTGLTMTVDSVADGDSFRAGDLEVRLLGVNAPEQVECFGTESQQWLEDAIGGQSVRLEIVDVDQFGRDLANVFVGDRWTNLEMVETGHALALSGSQNLVAAEEIAFRDRLGMWGHEICGAIGSPAQLVITALDFNPVGTDDQETVVVQNAGTESIGLRGFRLRDESSINRYDFPDRDLESGDSVTVMTGCPRGGSVLGWCSDSPVWNNDGDTALLLDSFGRIVSRYRYP